MNLKKGRVEKKMLPARQSPEDWIIARVSRRLGNGVYRAGHWDDNPFCSACLASLDVDKISPFRRG
jgi:hypothetical protein